MLEFDGQISQQPISIICLWRDSFLNKNFLACPTLGPLKIHLFQFWILSDFLENVLQLITYNILYFLIPFCIFYELKRKKEKKIFLKSTENFSHSIFDFEKSNLCCILYYESSNSCLIKLYSQYCSQFQCNSW